LNLVAWNDKESKYDLREWSTDYSKMGKGVTLSSDKAAALKTALSEL